MNSKEAFLKDLIEVCKKHNLSISHEDSHGGFLVRHGYDEKHYGEWLLAAEWDHRQKPMVNAEVIKTVDLNRRPALKEELEKKE
jgi:hypothetical protein